MQRRWIGRGRSRSPRLRCGTREYPAAGSPQQRWFELRIWSIRKMAPKARKKKRRTAHHGSKSMARHTTVALPLIRRERAAGGTPGDSGTLRHASGFLVVGIPSLRLVLPSSSIWPFRASSSKSPRCPVADGQMHASTGYSPLAFRAASLAPGAQLYILPRTNDSTHVRRALPARQQLRFNHPHRDPTGVRPEHKTADATSSHLRPKQQ
ncbi:hypothetical protein EJ06DRAFT_188467 [Trichodelitschia bisporula]|uniref:Uncharacterized protein n=1 Tax=Trichodelitschia bisporula TaxID=703511 RepID=A0A6G1I7R5_9PEZI|nr:hypothetical protein EJ06DRAFT_188467 [Trichodelitschia bisporula]